MECAIREIMRGVDVNYPTLCAIYKQSSSSTSQYRITASYEKEMLAGSVDSNVRRSQTMFGPPRYY